MKKFLLYIALFALIASLCGCGSLTASKDVYDTTFEPGAQLAVDGGQAEFVKVHTATRLYPTVHFGSYIEATSDDTCYIDVIFELKAGKKPLYSAELGSVSAIGNVSGVEYTDSICAIECDDNRNLHTNESVPAGESALVHMAVEVPVDTEDDEFEMKINILSSSYSFLYEFGDCIDNMQTIKKGQSISNQECKVKLNDAYYSYELYKDAPAICQSDDDYVYLIAELDVTNKGFEDMDCRKAVSLSAVFGGEIYDARYLMEDADIENHYISDGKIGSLDTARVLAVIDLPLDYSERAAKLELAIDKNEFSHTVDGDSSIAYNRERQLQEQRAAELAQQQAREEAARLAAEMDSQAAREQAQQSAEEETADTQQPADETAVQAQPESVEVAEQQTAEATQE